jgi:hypothetical protein
MCEPRESQLLKICEARGSSYTGRLPRAGERSQPSCPPSPGRILDEARSAASPRAPLCSTSTVPAAAPGFTPAPSTSRLTSVLGAARRSIPPGPAAASSCEACWDGERSARPPTGRRSRAPSTRGVGRLRPAVTSTATRPIRYCPSPWRQLKMHQLPRSGTTRSRRRRRSTWLRNCSPTAGGGSRAALGGSRAALGGSRAARSGSPVIPCWLRARVRRCSRWRRAPGSL